MHQLTENEEWTEGAIKGRGSQEDCRGPVSVLLGGHAIQLDWYH